MSVLARPALARREAAVTLVYGTASRARLACVAVLVGVGVLAALLLVVPGTVDVLDGQSMYQVTRSLVERGDVTVSAPVYGVAGPHGQTYSKYGPGQSLLAVPFYLAGRAVEPLVPAYFRPELPVMAASLLPAVATAVTAALLLVAAAALGAELRGAIGLALLYAFATPAAVYATQWFSEALTACAVMAAVCAVLWPGAAASWRPLAAGCALGLAMATRLEAVLLLPPLLLYVAMTPGRRVVRVALFLLPLLGVLAGLGAYDVARFGNPLETGYGLDHDAYALRDMHPVRSLATFVQGLYGLLISPGKGLIAYAPLTLLAPLGALALWRHRRAVVALLGALALIVLVVHANILIRWLGGWSWGPRFLMPALPLIVLLVAPLLDGRRWVTPALLVLGAVGLLVQLPALAVHEPHAYISTLQPAYQAVPGAPLAAQMAASERMEAAYVYQPGLSPIVGSWRLLARASTWAPPVQDAPTDVARKSVVFAPHAWWRLLALQGVDVTALVVACALLGLLALSCLLVALRLATRYSMVAPGPVY